MAAFDSGPRLPFFVGGLSGAAVNRWEGYRTLYPGFDFHLTEDPCGLMGFLRWAAGTGARHAVVSLDPGVALPGNCDAVVAGAIRHADLLVDRWFLLAAGGVTPGLEVVDYGFYTDAPAVTVSGDLTPCLAPFPQMQVWDLRSLVASEGRLDGVPDAERSDVAAVWAALADGRASFVSPWLHFGRSDRPPPRRGGGSIEMAEFLTSVLGDQKPGVLRLLQVLGANDRVSIAALTDRRNLAEAVAATGLQTRIGYGVRQSRPDARVSVVMRTTLSRPVLMRRALGSLALASASSPLHEVLLSADDRSALGRQLPDLRKAFPSLPLQPVATPLPALPSMCANLVAGVQAATGDYVWFLDDDDSAAPYSLAVIQSGIYSRCYPILIGECDLYEEVWGPLDRPQARIESLRHLRTYAPADWISALGGDNPVPLCAVVYPRTILQRIIREGLLRDPLNEDYALLLMALNDREAEVRVIRGKLAYISRRAGASSDNSVALFGPQARAAAIGSFMARILAPGAGYQVVLAQMGGRTAGLIRENAALEAELRRVTKASLEQGRGPVGDRRGSGREAAPGFQAQPWRDGQVGRTGHAFPGAMTRRSKPRRLLRWMLRRLRHTGSPGSSDEEKRRETTT